MYIRPWIYALIVAPSKCVSYHQQPLRVPMASPGSPSHGMNNFQLPSLYMFLAVDATSTVDYSKDVEVNDIVVDNPPAQVINLTYAPSPSPLYKEK